MGTDKERKESAECQQLQLSRQAPTPHFLIAD